MVPEPAEGPYGTVEADPDGEKRQSEPRRVHQEQERSLRDGLALAGQRQDSREDGADTRRGAEAESAAEKRRRAGAAGALDEPRRDEPVEEGSGSRPIMAKPRTTTRSPAIARSSSRFSPKRLPAAAAAAPRATKTPVKPATKGRLAATTRPAACAHLLAGDDGEVAGNEREDTGRRKRDEPGNERQRDLRLHQPSKRASSSPL